MSVSPPWCLPLLSPKWHHSVQHPPFVLMTWTHLMGMEVAGKAGHKHSTVGTRQLHHLRVDPSKDKAAAAQRQTEESLLSQKRVTPSEKPLSLQIMRGDPFVPTNVMSPPLNSQPFNKCCTRKLGGCWGSCWLDNGLFSLILMSFCDET